MDQAANNLLDNLSLSNLNQRIKLLRDQLRQSVQDDVIDLKNRVKNLSTYNKENKSVQKNYQYGDQPSRYQDSFVEEQSQKDYNIANQKLSDKLAGGKYASYGYQVQKQQSTANQPKYFHYLTLIQRQIDLQQIKQLNSKKFSVEEAHSYIKCVLNQNLWQKLQQLWLQYEDQNQNIELKKFVNRLFKLSLHYIQAVAVQIPKIKKKVSLKKILFQITYKSKLKKGQKITWEEFKQTIQNYKYQPLPTIDVVISHLQNQKQFLPKNHFIIPQQVLNELKTIYKRSSIHHFLHYCNSAALITKIQASKIIQTHLDTEVRRKSHLQTSKTVRQIVQYMKQKCTQFIDLDQYLLYFSTYPFAFYPIQERQVLNQNQQIEESSKSGKIERIKSPKNLTKQQKQRRINNYLNTLDNYYQTKKQNRQQALYLKQQIIEAQLSHKFKARQMPKSLSNEKYREFLNKLQKKKQQMRNKQLISKEKSQKILERFKSLTKLLQAPKQRQSKFNKPSFKARPVPEQILESKLKDIEAYKKQRKNKIMSLNQQKYTRSWQQLPQVAIYRQKSPKKQEPKQILHIQHHYYTQIPNYKVQQNKISQQLEERKKNFKPTIIQQFNLQTEQRHPQNNCKHNNEYYFKQPAYYHQEEYDYKQILYSPQPEIYFTQKYADMLTANQNRVFQRELILNKKLQQEKQRQKKHQKFTKFMKVPLSRIPNTAKICEVEGKAKIQRHKKYWKKLDVQYQNELNELYAKVIKRPFLYEMQSKNVMQYRPLEVNQNIPKKKKKQKNKPKISQTRYKDNQVMNRSF